MLSIPERFARHTQARALALGLMGLHGLTGWSFRFNRHKRTLGLCRYEAKAIELSVYLVYHNGMEELRDTILHEVRRVTA